LAVAINRHQRLLVFPDLHCPYQHPDAVDFLGALKKKHRPTRVIGLGDESDGHDISYHESNPDLMSAGYELRAAIRALEPIYRLFPEVDMMWSNHGSLVFRKGLSAGLPADVFKSYNEIYHAPKGWVWHQDLTLELPNGQSVYFCHGRQANALGMSQKLGMCTVNGHYHTQFSIQKWSTPLATNWAMVCGCLIDPRSSAYAYNHLQVLRPILGAGVILDSQPRLELMLLDKRGRWTGKLYG
jgi:hypothetical protein